MGQEKTTSHAIEWLKNAKDKILALAEGEKGRRSAEPPRVGVALAGGFARGIAHIGVLQVLQEEGIPIHCVAGTSVGALIGVGYCAGVPLAEMEALGAATCFSDFGRWVPSWLGLATNQRMEKYLTRLTTIRNFEALKTPLAISATDINAGVTVYYSSGPIAPALRASCAYPGLFVPIQYEGRTLVDGFLTSPVPVEGAMLLGADVVIAVYLETTGADNPRTMVDVISRSFNIIQRHADITWRQQADVIIEPDVQKIGWEDFGKTPEMVAAGREATKKALPEIRAAIQAERRDSAESSSQPTATSTERG